MNYSGAVAERYCYTPYGAVTYCNASWSNIGSSAYANTILFSGHQLDAATSLYYCRARYYDPALQRFVSQDPMGLAAGMNSYRYCDNGPTDATDASGRLTRAPAGGAGPEENGSFEYRWSFTADQPATESLTVIQRIDVFFVNWKYVDDGKSVGDLGSVQYFEVLGTIAPSSTQVVPPSPPAGNATNGQPTGNAANSQSMVDTWNFGSDGRVNGRPACGSINMYGQARPFRTADIARSIANWQGTTRFESSGKTVKVPWTSGVLPASKQFSHFQVRREIVEREEVNGNPTYTGLRAIWGLKRLGNRTEVTHLRPPHDPGPQLGIPVAGSPFSR